MYAGVSLCEQDGLPYEPKHIRSYAFLYRLKKTIYFCGKREEASCCLISSFLFFFVDCNVCIYIFHFLDTVFFNQLIEPVACFVYSPHFCKEDVLRIRLFCIPYYNHTMRFDNQWDKSLPETKVHRSLTSILKWMLSVYDGCLEIRKRCNTAHLL